MEKIGLFFEKVQTDVELQEKLRALQGKTQDEAVDTVVALALENGFEVTRDDFLRFVETAKASAAKNGELNEAELDAVAGGGLPEWVIMSVGSMGLGCAASLVGKLFDTCWLDHPDRPLPPDGA